MALQIELDFVYLEILEINDNDFSITFRVDLMARWNEPRIIPPPKAIHDKIDIPIDISVLEHLWIMNLFVYNLKEIQKYKVLSPSQNSIGLNIVESKHYDLLNIFYHLFKQRMELSKSNL